MTADKTLLAWFIESVASFVDYNLEKSQRVALSTLLPAFESKRASIMKALDKSTVLDKAQVSKVGNALKMIMDYHTSHNSDVMVPVG